MLQSVGPCLEASFHSGIGNWMYISVEVGLVALATNHSLILPDFMHMAFGRESGKLTSIWWFM